MGSIISLEKKIAVVLLAGGLLYGYGVAARFEIVPGTGFLVGAIVYVFAAIGALLLSIGGVTGAVALRHDRSRSLTEREVIKVVTIAPILSVAAMFIFWSWSIDMLMYDLEFLAYTFLGQAALSAQLLVGSLQTKYRRILLGVETSLVVVIVVLLFTGLRRTHIDYLLLIGGGSAILFLLTISPIYVIGNQISDNN